MKLDEVDARDGSRVHWFFRLPQLSPVWGVLIVCVAVGILSWVTAAEDVRSAFWAAVHMVSLPRWGAICIGVCVGAFACVTKRS